MNDRELFLIFGVKTVPIPRVTMTLRKVQLTDGRITWEVDPRVRPRVTWGESPIGGSHTWVPVHPNCRCTMIPEMDIEAQVRKEMVDDVARSIDREIMRNWTDDFEDAMTRVKGIIGGDD